MDDTTKQLLQAALAGAVRHALTAAAGALVTAGLIQSGDSSSFVTIATGIVVGGAGLAWSWWQKKGQAAVVAKLQALKIGGQTAVGPGSK